MSGVKRYEILEHLPPYGPMYISVTEGNEIFASEGFVVRFYKSDGSDWVANFKPGLTRLNEIIILKDSPNILVIAGGECYLMPFKGSSPISVFGKDCETILKTADERFILQCHCDLIIVETNGTYWKTEQISLDGMKNVRLEGNVVIGLAYDPMDSSCTWKNFWYNIDNKTLEGGSFSRTLSLTEKKLTVPFLQINWIPKLLILLFIIYLVVHYFIN